MDTQLAVTIGCLRDEGLTFVCRYYDDSGNRSAKCMDRAEVDALHAAGLQIFSVYETCAGVCTGRCTGSPCGVEYFTQAQGEYDGRAALEMILAVYESARVNGPVDLPLKNRQHPLTLF